MAHVPPRDVRRVLVVELVVGGEPEEQRKQAGEAERGDKVTGVELDDTAVVLLEHHQLRHDRDGLDAHGHGPCDVGEEVGVERGVEERGQDEARDEDVEDAELVRDAKRPEPVVRRVVRRAVLAVDEGEGDDGDDEGEDLDELVEPVAALVEREVPLVEEDRAEAEEERQAVQLQRLGGDACGEGRRGGRGGGGEGVGRG